MKNKERILFDKVKEYLESKPFIEKTGCGDIYHFRPMHHAGSYSTLSELERAINQSRVDSIRKDNNEFKGALETVINSMNLDENVYQLTIDTYKEDEEYAESICLFLSDDICDSLSRIVIRNNPSLADRLYIEYRIREETSKELTKKFGLKLAEGESNILCVYKEIESTRDIDELFKFGFAYSMQVTSKNYSEDLDEVVDRFDKLIKYWKC